MGRPCRVCSLPTSDRAEVEDGLRVYSYRSVSRLSRISLSSLWRHSHHPQRVDPPQTTEPEAEPTRLQKPQNYNAVATWEAELAQFGWNLSDYWQARKHGRMQPASQPSPRPDEP